MVINLLVNFDVAGLFASRNRLEPTGSVWSASLCVVDVFGLNKSLNLFSGNLIYLHNIR